MGLGLQVAVIVSTFSFQEIITIELSEEDVETTLKAIKASSLNLSPITIRVGRVQVAPSSVRTKLTYEQDYFIVDADISYLDCNLLGPFLDEGLFLDSFFNCCLNLQCQSFLILLTRYDGYDLEEKGFEVILYQYSKQSSHLWLCRKL
jgi:hypothetical protein